MSVMDSPPPVVVGMEWRFGKECMGMPALYGVVSRVDRAKRYLDGRGVLTVGLDRPAVLGRIEVFARGDVERLTPLCVLYDNLKCRKKRWALPPTLAAIAAKSESFVLCAGTPVEGFDGGGLG